MIRTVLFSLFLISSLHLNAQHKYSSKDLLGKWFVDSTHESVPSGFQLRLKFRKKIILLKQFEPSASKGFRKIKFQFQYELNYSDSSKESFIILHLSNEAAVFPYQKLSIKEIGKKEIILIPVLGGIKQRELRLHKRNK